MKKFRVQMIRTVLRTVVVEADNATAAKRRVREYGVAEAFSDFPELEGQSFDHIHLAKSKPQLITEEGK